jgi:hypothetical protein
VIPKHNQKFPGELLSLLTGKILELTYIRAQMYKKAIGAFRLYTTPEK